MSQLLIGIAVGAVLSSVLPGAVAIARLARPSDHATESRQAILTLIELAHRRQLQAQGSWRSDWSTARALARRDPRVMVVVATDMIGVLVDAEDELGWAALRERAKALVETWEQRDRAARAQLPWWRRWVR